MKYYLLILLFIIYVSNCTYYCQGLPDTDDAACSFWGTCIANDTCLCLDGYWGKFCQYVPVGGGECTDNQGCSTPNGYCNITSLPLGKCVCNEGYIDDWCMFNAICAGYPYPSMEGCNNRGTCINMELCNCTYPYAGSYCEMTVPYCAGYFAPDTRGCLNRGTCIANETCSCTYPYAGQYCGNTVPFCDGYFYPSQGGCTNRGVCVANETCDCTHPYAGKYCGDTVPFCYGHFYPDQTGCSGHGVCVANNTCNCTVPYTGTYCEITTYCQGFAHPDRTGCSDHGMCITNDTCLCDYPYFGEYCDNSTVAYCDGYFYPDKRGCSNHGTCIANFTCSCEYPYTGLNCEIPPYCQGHAYPDTTGCSGHGICTATDTCNCTHPYIGQYCDQIVSYCYGYYFPDQRGCSNHGVCTGNYTCACTFPYYGDQCQYSPLCNGVYYPGMGNPASKTGCYGHGNCYHENNCTCMEYGNYNVYYWGEYCQYFPVGGVSCASNSTCYYPKGECIGGKCDCTDGYYMQNCYIGASCQGISHPSKAGCSNHGTCINLNLCSCEYPYIGTYCQTTVPYCNGHFAPSTFGCNDRGICVANGTCNCTYPYTGQYCQSTNTPYCNGYFYPSEEGCSNHGVCVANETCNCTHPYTGIYCTVYHSCDGYFYPSTEGCSFHGTCVGNETCNCTYPYTGDYCQYTPYCQEFAYPDTTGCSGHGTCIVNSTCQCVSPYTGTYCNIYHSCNGHFYPSTEGCHNRGECIGNETCSCTHPYAGTYCETTVPFCNGYFAPDTLGCNDHGVCVANETCSCTHLYVGTYCDIYHSCNGHFYPNTTGCNDHGICIGNETCNCTYPYLGQYCDTSIASCNGIFYPDKRGCLNRGECIGLNVCNCTYPYTDIYCNNTVPFCNGHFYPSTLGCSSLGTCIANQTCDCNFPYYGQYCEFLPSCQGYDYPNTTGCFDRGTCTGNDICTCNHPYTGTHCQTTTPFCNGYFSPDMTGCSNRGNCVANETCVCTYPYAGVYCETIVPSCNGYFVPDTKGCLDHGTCISNDTCNCTHPYSGQFCQEGIYCQGYAYVDNRGCSDHGRCVSNETCVCNAPYYGQYCQYDSFPVVYWTWINGSEKVNNVGNYGHKYITDPNNNPISRSSHSMSNDKRGNIYLFGGISTPGYLNDLWKWNGIHWTWFNGSSSAGDVGHYGDLHLPHPENTPSNRIYSTMSSDNNGNIYVFGGITSTGNLNDLWKWDGTYWTWISGSSSVNDVGYYGDKYVPLSNNTPSSRSYHSMTSDNNGNLYVFGGYRSGYLNDLWKWDGVYWTWINGSSSVNDLGNYGQKYISAPTNSPISRIRHSMTSDNSGNLYIFGGERISTFLNDLWKWDGTYWTWINGSSSTNDLGNYGVKHIPHPDNSPKARNLHSMTSDNNGNIYIFGGERSGYLSDLWRWDGTYWTWISGSSSANQDAIYGTKYITDQNNIAGSRHDHSMTSDSNGNLYIFGGLGYSPFVALGYLNDLWKVNKETSLTCFGKTGIEACNYPNGVCLTIDTCSCFYPYIGAYCNTTVPFCNGYFSPSTLGCSNRGECIANATCNCTYPYTGQYCEIVPICQGIAYPNATGCSDYGTCVSSETCNCIYPYTGQYCQYTPTCQGIAYPNATGCMDHGTCIGNETCTCVHPYIGQYCNETVYICNGYYIPDMTGCNNHGTCVANEVCNCTYPYVGTYCDNTIIYCNGYFYPSTAGCSDRGICVANETCNCTYPYTGQYCENTPECQGYFYPNTTGCLDRGTCIGNGICECTHPYAGTYCENTVPFCYGYFYPNTTGCSNHGVCIANTTCNCTYPYYGIQCENKHIECFGYYEGDSNTGCSNHGNCTSDNTCVCEQAYFGNQCQNPAYCQGYAYPSKVGCNGNGTCIANNTCVCDVLHYGPFCQYDVTCYGINFHNPSVCSAYGQCVAQDTCVCDAGHFGSNCQYLTLGGNNCSSNSECNGAIFCAYNSTTEHGLCGQCTQGKCVCNTGYISANCDEIATCQGMIFTNGSSCSNHGTCINLDLCQCNTGYYGQYCQNLAVCFGYAYPNTTGCLDHGTCIGLNNCNCTGGYEGSGCELAPIDRCGVVGGNGVCDWEIPDLNYTQIRHIIHDIDCPKSVNFNDTHVWFAFRMVGVDQLYALNKINALCGNATLSLSLTAQMLQVGMPVVRPNVSFVDYANNYTSPYYDYYYMLILPTSFLDQCFFNNTGYFLLYVEKVNSTNLLYQTPCYRLYVPGTSNTTRSSGVIDSGFFSEVEINCFNTDYNFKDKNYVPNIDVTIANNIDVSYPDTDPNGYFRLARMTKVSGDDLTFIDDQTNTTIPYVRNGRDYRKQFFEFYTTVTNLTLGYTRRSQYIFVFEWLSQRTLDGTWVVAIRDLTLFANIIHTCKGYFDYGSVPLVNNLYLDPMLLYETQNLYKYDRVWMRIYPLIVPLNMFTLSRPHFVLCNSPTGGVIDKCFGRPDAITLVDYRSDPVNYLNPSLGVSWYRSPAVRDRNLTAVWVLTFRGRFYGTVKIEGTLDVDLNALGSMSDSAECTKENACFPKKFEATFFEFCPRGYISKNKYIDGMECIKSPLLKVITDYYDYVLELGIGLSAFLIFSILIFILSLSICCLKQRKRRDGYVPLHQD